IGLAKWRLDGFVSLRSRDRGEGVIETVPFQPDGRNLTVNANASDGAITAELLDTEGHPIPGYYRSECHPVTADSGRSPIRWRDHQQLPPNKPLAVRFYLQNAEIFSYTVK